MRTITPEAETIIDKKFDVLDHGYVVLTDYMGGDADIANAARVSNAGQVSKKSSNRGLVRYLFRHKHTSPFEMVVFKFVCRMPIFVARQWIRHRTACLAGDMPISFDLPGGKTKSGLPRHYTLTVKQIYDKWQPTRATSRPDKQRNSLFKRERVQSMLLRNLNEDSYSISHTHITGITLSGTKTVYLVKFDDGSLLRATGDHKCLTSSGWMTLHKALGHGVKFIGSGKKPSVSKEVKPLSKDELVRERWKPIPGLPSNYEVSDLGRIRNWNNTRGTRLDVPKLKKITVFKGYPLVSLSSQGKTRVYKVHTLVLSAFSRLPRSGEQARHGDDCTQNSRLKNLSWGRAQDNSNDRMEHGCDQRLTSKQISVISWKEDGEEEVYDISVKGPHHNFFAGGVVVHNSVNEVSGRYSVLSDEFYVPTESELSFQSKGNNQGRAEGKLSHEKAIMVLSLLKSDAEIAFRHYHGYLGEDISPCPAPLDIAMDELKAGGGLARELARINLPLSTYTEWVWKIDLHNLLHFLSLRLDKHAQWEIRQYAAVLYEMVKAVAPQAVEAFRDYQLLAVTFSRQEREVLAKVLGQSLIKEIVDRLPNTSSDMSEREWTEFRDKLMDLAGLANA